MSKPRLLQILLLVALAAPASAQVYKWVDKDGKVHYSDKAPRDPQAKDVKDMGIQSNPTDESAVAAELEALKMRGVSVDQEIAERKKGEAALAEKKAKQEERERRCANARADLNVLNSVQRVVVVDADNKEVHESGEQLVERRKKAEAKVAELCD